MEIEKIKPMKFGEDITIYFTWIESKKQYRLKMIRRYYKTACKFADTADDARRLAIKWGDGVSDKTLAQKDSITVSAIIENWIADCASCGIHARNSTSGYTNSLRTHIAPVIGNIPVQKLKSRDIALMFDALRAKPLRGGKVGLGDDGIQWARKALNGALKFAIANRVIAVNPLDEISDREDRVREKKAKQARAAAGGTGSKRNHAIRKEDIARLVARCDGTDWMHDLILFAYGTGMRVGEICGLRWGDVDLEAGVVHIRQQIDHEASGKMHFTLPKGDKIRDVEISTDLVAQLSRRKAGATTAALAGGIPHDELGSRPVFDDGRLPEWNRIYDGWVSPRTVAQAFRKRFARRLGLRTVGGKEASMHGFRHAHGTHLVDGGAVIGYVAERLGHSNVRTTMDYYLSSTPEGRSETTKLWGELVAGMLEKAPPTVVPLRGKKS